MIHYPPLSLARQLGNDQISARYFLSNMTQYANAMQKVQWQLSGGKNLSSTSLKEVGRSIEGDLKKCSKALDERKKEARAQHDQSLQYLRGLETAMNKMVEALGQINIVSSNPLHGQAPPAPAMPIRGLPRLMTLTVYHLISWVWDILMELYKKRCSIIAEV